MKKLFITVYAAFLVIVLANFFYYTSLYNKQIKYITTLLDRQVQIVGLTVDDANNNFTSDLTKISNPDDLLKFFTDPAIKEYGGRKHETLLFKVSEPDYEHQALRQQEK